MIISSTQPSPAKLPSAVMRVTKLPKNVDQYSETGGTAMTRKYWAIFEWSGKNFSGYAPDIPGCMATAKTRDGVRRRLRGAVEAHLEWLQNDGNPIPEASQTVTVDMTSDAEYANPKGHFLHVEQVEAKVPKPKRIAAARKSHSRELAAA